MVVAGLAQHGDYGKWRRAARAVRGGADALAPRTELRHLKPGYCTHLESCSSIFGASRDATSRPRRSIIETALKITSDARSTSPTSNRPRRGQAQWGFIGCPL